MDVDDASRSHAAEMIGWLPLGQRLGLAPRAGGWYGHQSALAGPAGCGALGEERQAGTNSAARRMPLFKNEEVLVSCRDLEL